MLLALDSLCFALHTSLILFNLLAWIWPATRRLHLLGVALTLVSWLGLGPCYGFGYCICTDLHFRIREARGIEQADASYVHLLIQTVTGFDLDRGWVEAITIYPFAIAVFLSLVLNIRDARRRRKEVRSALAPTANRPFRPDSGRDAEVPVE